MARTAEALVIRTVGTGWPGQRVTGGQDRGRQFRQRAPSDKDKMR